MLLDLHDLRHVDQLWPQLAGATGRLINHSENHTFLFEGRAGRHTLRVHRHDYQDRASIESELDWLEALRQDTDLAVPQPVAGADGELLQVVDTGSGDQRFAVLFGFIPGTEPTIEDDLTSLFGQLGATAAKLHCHAIRWQRPKGFVRQSWNAASILDPDGLWGNWRSAPGMDQGTKAIIENAAAKLRHHLDAYGTASARYGLIHADMRLGNLLLDSNHLSLIDFDDSGFCWFTYDFAASISFYETHEAVPALRAAWLDGYRRVRSLTAADIDSLDAMALLRRIALLAWIGTHSETPLAQRHMPGFAAGTALLAKRYLGRA